MRYLKKLNTTNLLKFRVWDDMHKHLCAPKFWFSEVTGLADFWQWVAQHDAQKNVTQFIGVKDKEGREIYDGDMVKFDYRGKEAWGMIGFDDMYCGYSLQCSKAFMGSGSIRIDGDGTVDDYTVIGNIFESPDMLKNQPDPHEVL